MYSGHRESSLPAPIEDAYQQVMLLVSQHEVQRSPLIGYQLESGLLCLRVDK